MGVNVLNEDSSSWDVEVKGEVLTNGAHERPTHVNSLSHFNNLLPHVAMTMLWTRMKVLKRLNSPFLKSVEDSEIVSCSVPGGL